jgi:O-antigen/teichoic acid export membrane protein
VLDPAATSRRVARNFLSASTGSLVNRFMHAFAVIYLARVLGPSTYGELSWAQAALVFGVCFSDLGLQTLGIKSLSEDPRDPGKAICRYLSLRISLAAVAGIGVTAFAIVAGPTPAATQLTAVYAVTLLVSGLSTEWVYISLQSMHLVGLARLVQGTLYLGVLALLVRAPGDVLIVPIVAGATAALSAIALLASLRRRIPGFRPRFDLTGWRSLLARSLPIGAADLLIHFYITLPLILVGTLRSPLETGLYAGAYRMQLVLQESFGWFFIALYPIAAYRWKNSAERMVPFLDAVLRLVLLVTIPMAFLVSLGAPWAIVAVLGTRYAGSAQALRIMCWNLIPVGVGGVFKLLVLLMGGRHRLYLLVVACGAAFGLPLSFVLIRIWGSIGAAVSWPLAESLVAIIAWWLSLRMVRLPVWSRVWPPAVAALSMLAAAGSMATLAAPVVAQASAACVAYIATLVVLKGIDANDLALLKRVLGRSSDGGAS